MEKIAGYYNGTLSQNQINAVMALISLISARIFVGSFTLVSNLEDRIGVEFQREASKYFLGIGFENGEPLDYNDNRGFLIMKDPDFDFSKIVETEPRLMVVVLFTKEKNPKPPKLLSKLVIPPSTSFFLVMLSEDLEEVSPNGVKGKCFRIYRPVSDIRLKSYPVISYVKETEKKLKWRWESEERDWGFSKKAQNMSEATVTIAIVSHKPDAVEIFLKRKNSFFWRACAEHLKYRANYHLEKIPADAEKSITLIYVQLIMTMADGLAILPAITAERAQILEFITTGLDSKVHLMVREPQFVHSWQSILKPLALDSWICLGFAILLIAVALRFVAEKPSSTDFSYCLLTAIGFICCQSCTNLPRNFSGRLVCYTGLIFSIIIYQYYTSNFYSLLSTKEVSLPFTSLEQFVALKTHTLHMHPDTGIYSEIKKAKSGTLKRLWDEILKKDPTHQLTTHLRGQALRKVCQGTGAIFGMPFQTVHLPELTCKLVLVNSGYFPMNLVTVVRKGFPFKAQFKFVHLRLLESGLSHKFRDDQLNSDQHRATKTDVINEPVSLEHVAFPFAFYAAAVVLSFLVFALEIIASMSFKKTNKRSYDNHKKILVMEKRQFPRKLHPL